MILGIGVDLIQVARMNHWVSQGGLIERFFHHKEVDDAASRGEAAMAASLAARYAAKEALAKAIGTGLKHFKLREVQVVNDPHGKPEILLHGEAAKIMEEFGGKRIHLSLTHELDNAIAMVVIEG